MSDQPNMKRIQLGRMLKQLRKAAGKSDGDVIRERIVRSKSTLYNLEAGGVKEVSWPIVVALAHFYEAPLETVTVLRKMAEATLEPGWYEPYGQFGNFSMYLELEVTATALYIYENEYVNGLFQTADYLRALPTPEGDVREQVVNTRMARQHRIWDSDVRPTIHLILSEAVIRRQVGGPEVMRQQIDRLVELSKQPSVRVEILPFSAGAHPSMTGPYSVMDFSGDVFPSVAYVESFDGCRYHDTPAVVEAYHRMFDETARLAVPIREHLS